ncbi:hypothetical protein UFOVP423_3 [uncultured Caudovirales phage]|jgi:hypothetical protein|uniref:Uncharacterized protein n=1 Tax=uncultured Caudovirales phage TaxID=2100421 RepID=A0A6J5MDY4_9CAUD|nr:hypothetical protein UFOVP423_3 [uncultured Caudovirales phage]
MTEIQLKLIDEAAQVMILKARLRKFSDIAEDANLSVQLLKYHAQKRVLEMASLQANRRDS